MSTLFILFTLFTVGRLFAYCDMRAVPSARFMDRPGCGEPPTHSTRTGQIVHFHAMACAMLQETDDRNGPRGGHAMARAMLQLTIRVKSLTFFG